MKVKILNIKTSISPKEDMEEKINTILEENDVYPNQIINIQFITSHEVAIFYIE